MAASSTTVAVLHPSSDHSVYGQIKLENRELRPIKEHEVLIRMKNVGICGSDVHYWTHGRIGDFVVHKPMVLGHESAGIIEAVGAGVHHLKVGDKVAIEPGVPCASCQFCLKGRYNLCRDIQFLATPPVDGSLATHHIHHGSFVFKLPDNVSTEEGALCEPLSVGLHACSRANVTLGSSVLITGAGPIGLVSFLAAKACGATKIAIIDIQKERLEFAKNKLGVKYVFESDKNVLSKLREITAEEGGGFDVAIECSGAQPAIATAMEATKNGGKVVFVGLGPSRDVTLPIVDASVREVDLLGVFRYCNTYPKAISLISSGLIDVKPLITSKYSLQDVVKAFDVARSGTGGNIKVMFDI